MPRWNQSTQERFESKYEVDEKTGCWNWTAAKDKSGYGEFKEAGKRVRAHRFAYLRVHGEIPSGDGHHGTCICHKCDNPSGVNPEHLFAGSMADNMKDMHQKGRSDMRGLLSHKGDTNALCK